MEISSYRPLPPDRRPEMSGTPDRFTECARRVMLLGRQEAQRVRHEYIGTEHLLLGLAAESSGDATVLLGSLGVDRKDVRREVEKIVIAGPDDGIMTGRMPQT